ncbi:hypothetical protein EVAR_21478_1 [Eumeta japonica]|uniref:Uncharacterized protein n=1 Tax=Eumeta variegata TaxID=151549 RepID=A0A4C1ZIS6_EUMVA|nr:hypothetical protein EVAR_21478_1 [Eumeta japonica]
MSGEYLMGVWHPGTMAIPFSEAISFANNPTGSPSEEIKLIDHPPPARIRDIYLESSMRWTSGGAGVAPSSCLDKAPITFALRIGYRDGVEL